MALIVYAFSGCLSRQVGRHSVRFWPLCVPLSSKLLPAAGENFVIDDYIGRVFMAYDFEGQPMACSTLQAAVPASDGGFLVAGHAEGWGGPGAKFGESARASTHVPRAPACATRTEGWCVACCRRCLVSSGRSLWSEKITPMPSSRGSS